MNTQLNIRCLCLFLLFCTLPASSSIAEWIRIINWQNIEPGDGETELWHRGWVFQDDDFDENEDCLNGIQDCTGVRDVISAPPFISPPNDESRSIRLRAIAEDATWIPRRASYTAIPIPPISTGSVATVYVRFAVAGYGEHTIGTGVETEDGYSFENFATAIRLSSENKLLIYNQNSYQSHGGTAAGRSISPLSWYQLWLRVDNRSPANGGGVYDVYIQQTDAPPGSPFEQLTHLLNPFNAEGTWRFRDGQANGRAFDKFIIVNSNLTMATSVPDEELYINDIFLYPGDMHSCFDCGHGFRESTPYWGSYPAHDNGWVDTKDFMGWLHVTHDPWAYSSMLQSWVHLPEEFVTPGGSWLYLPR